MLETGDWLATCDGAQGVRMTGSGDHAAVVGRGGAAGGAGGGGGCLYSGAGGLLRAGRSRDVVEGEERDWVVAGAVPDQVSQLQTLAGVELAIVTPVGHSEGLVVLSPHISLPGLHQSTVRGAGGQGGRCFTSKVRGLSKLKVTLQPS